MIWKDVKGYEGLYKVSDTGDVLSLERKGTKRGDHILSATKDRVGYKMVGLSKKGRYKKCRVHRLVAEAFIANPNNYKEVNHKDEDKWNCRRENLEWCSRAYNVTYGTRTQKTRRRIAAYSKSGEFFHEYDGIREACRINGFPYPGNISRVLNGKAAHAYGFVWKEIG